MMIRYWILGVRLGFWVWEISRGGRGEGVPFTSCLSPGGTGFLDAVGFTFLGSGLSSRFAGR